MIQRKIQLIAGTTYTVSLPKEWVERHNLKAQQSIFLDEKGDGSISLLPAPLEKQAGNDSISINIDNQEGNVSHILYAAYYTGVENVRLFSKKEIPQNTRTKIKKTISNLSGVEVVFEDLDKIDLKVLLDITKTTINQLGFRMTLLINSAISIIEKRESLQDLDRTEDEIDRIHHMITKLIFRASDDASVLQTSGIKKITHILPYSIISKKFENIGDSLVDLGKQMHDRETKNTEVSKILSFFKMRISRDASLITKGDLPQEHAKDMAEISRITKVIDTIKDPHISIYLATIAKCIVDIEEEILNLSYYRKLGE